MSVDVAALREARDRYDAWLDSRPDVSDAMCWTAAVSGDSLDEAMGCFSADWQRVESVGFEELVQTSFADREDGSRAHLGWLITTGAHVALLEINGFGGSTPSSLRAWSHRYGRVAGMFWNVNSVNRLSIGHGDHFESVEMGGGQDDLVETGPLVGGYSPILSGTMSWAAGLAVVEAETGLRLDEHVLAHEWPIVRFAARQLTPARPPMKIARDDAVLAMALTNAAPERLNVAMTITARAVIDAAGLSQDPGAQLAMRAISQGLALPLSAPGTSDELVQLVGRLWAELQESPHRPGDPDDPAFRRYQAAATLSSFTHPWKRDEGWLHARFALADRWGPIRDRLLDAIG